MTRRLARVLRALAVDADLLRRRRELRLLIFGQATSLLGSMITMVAVPVQLYELTGSTVAVGLLGVAEFVPILVLALVGGALADAFDRRRLVMLAEVGAIVVVGGLVAQRDARGAARVVPLRGGGADRGAAAPSGGRRSTPCSRGSWSATS